MIYSNVPGNVPTLIPNISNLCLSFPDNSVYRFINFIDLFEEPVFGYLDIFLYCLSFISLISRLTFIISFFLLILGLVCSSFLLS